MAARFAFVHAIASYSREKRRINFVRGGSRHFGTQRSCRSLAANSMRGGGLDLVSPKSRKTITKLGRTKCPSPPHLASPPTTSSLRRGNFPRQLSARPGNCSERNRYIADFKVGQRDSPFFFIFAGESTTGVAAVLFPRLSPRDDDRNDRDSADDCGERALRRSDDNR